jgi:predicted aspartyl protease
MLGASLVAAWRHQASYCSGLWKLAEFVVQRRSFIFTCRVHQWFVTAVLLLFSLAALGTVARAAIVLQRHLSRLGYEQIELRHTDENHLFLLGRLNGRQRSALVDTGWSFTTVSTNAAVKLKTPSQQRVALHDPFFGTNENPSIVLMDNLKLGRVEFTSQPALVQNMVLNGQRAPFDVVLGCDFLMRNFAVIDCLNRRLYVRRAMLSEQQQEDFEETLRRNGYVAVKLERKDPLALTCPARVNAEPVEMLVDTGAVWSCLDAGQAQRLHLKPLPTPRRISGAGATGTRAFAVAEVKSLAFGDVAMKGANFALLDLGDWGFAAPGKGLSEVHGILGGSELTAGSAIIDCHRLMVWVKRSGVSAERR